MLRSGFAALLAAFLFACAAPVYERNWIEVETPNFRITATFDQASAVDLAQQLELFRAVIQSITNVPTLDSPVPTRIFVFDGRYDFALFMKRTNVVGAFAEGMRLNHVIMRKDRDLDASRVIRHEYVHFVMNNATDKLYPPWYSEGFAEFLSTVTLHGDGDHVIVGAFPSDRRRGFKSGVSVPYEQIISARPGSVLRGTMLYEQSWALVHWLQLGRDSERPLERDMDRYLDLIGAGSSDVDAFEEAFGITLRELRKELIDYLKGEYEAVAISLASLHYEPASPRVRTLPQDEIAVELGELALVFERSDLAQDYFTSARSENPRNARAHAGLGKSLAASGREAEAESQFARAISIGANDAEIQLDYAKFLHRTALENGDATAAQERLERSRTHYQHSLTLDPQIPETHAMYGRSFLAPGQNAAQGIASLERAQALLPANPIILKLLARAYLLSGRESDARPLVARVVATAHEDDRVAKADEMLASIREADDEPW